MRTSITPNCRYGHGDLGEVQAGTASARWAIQEHQVSKVGGDAESTKLLTPGMSLFSLRIFKCPVCGYLEFFDDEA